MAGDVDQTLPFGKSVSGPGGMDLAKVVTVDKPYEWTEGSWVLGS
jgi:carbamoyl-phosphate synthase small subunit